MIGPDFYHVFAVNGGDKSLTEGHAAVSAL